MASERSENAPIDNSEVVNAAYDDLLLKCFDILERQDFYGVVAIQGVSVFAEQLALGPNSHVLDIGSGIGGPARYFAKRYGCRVTGIDLSEFNHRIAVERSREAGLDHLVKFFHGDAMTVSLVDASFTHVFGCETLCYFPDKSRVYELARLVLKPGGMLAFLEAACDVPVRLRTEDYIGPVRYESAARYSEMLKRSGFQEIQSHDTTSLALHDVANSLYRLLTRKEQVVATAGEDVYFPLLEIWAEFLAYFTEGKLKHFGFIARKYE
jgi:SAM-dependent methyltransferase